MDDQTKVSGRNGSPTTSPKALTSEVGEFAHDVFVLAELQTQLLIADAQEYGQRVLGPGLILMCGMALGVACFPIALVALALLLIQVFETSYAVGFLMAVVVGAALSALLCFVGWFQVRQRAAVLRRSQQELARNLSWIKKVLERSRIARRNSTDNSWRTVS